MRRCVRVTVPAVMRLVESQDVISGVDERAVARQIVAQLGLGPESVQKARETIQYLVACGRLMHRDALLFVPTEEQRMQERRKFVINTRGRRRPFCRGRFWNDRSYHGRPRRDRKRGGILVPASVAA